VVKKKYQFRTCFPENGSHPYAKKTSINRIRVCSSPLSRNYHWHSAWRKKAVYKVRKIPLPGSRTTANLQKISSYFRRFVKQLDKLKKAQLFGIQLDEATDISDEVQFILYSRFADG